MEKIKPRTLSGFMELLPEAQSQMDAVMDVLRATYALFGFTNIDSAGQSGLELSLDKYLTGMDGKMITQTDRNGNIVPISQRRRKAFMSALSSYYGDTF